MPNTHHVYRSLFYYAGSLSGALQVLVAALPKRTPARWLEADLDRYRRTLQHALASTPVKGLGPYQVAAALREVFPRDTIATIDTGSHRIMINHVWQSFEPRRLLQSNGLG